MEIEVGKFCMTRSGHKALVTSLGPEGDYRGNVYYFPSGGFNSADGKYAVYEIDGGEHWVDLVLPWVMKQQRRVNMPQDWQLVEVARSIMKFTSDRYLQIGTAMTMLQVMGFKNVNFGNGFLEMTLNDIEYKVWGFGEVPERTNLPISRSTYKVPAYGGDMYYGAHPDTASYVVRDGVLMDKRMADFLDDDGA